MKDRPKNSVQTRRIIFTATIRRSLELTESSRELRDREHRLDEILKAIKRLRSEDFRKKNMSTWEEHVDPNATVAGFRMTEPDPDHSTLNCPCGQTFTWSGPGGKAIEEWIATHTPHQKKEVG